MEEQYKVNRLKSTNEIRPLVDNHWAELRTAKERGEFVAWASGPTFIFAYAMGMKCHFMAGYSAYCGGIGAGEEVLKVANMTGDLPESCSYHRLHMGLAEAVKRGIEINPQAILPIPDLMIAGRFCPEMSYYAEGLYRRMGVDVLAVEFPIIFNREDLAKVREYMYRQFKEVVIPAVEKTCGKPFDYDRMSEILALLKKVATLRNQCWEFFKDKPSRWTLWDYGVSIAPVFYLMGNPKGLEYYERLLKELQERRDNNIPAIAPNGEKYRLYWDGWLPWSFLGKYMRKFTPHGAVCLCGRYPWEFFPHPELIDPEHPVETWADMYFGEESHLAWNASPKGTTRLIGELIEDYSIDGMVMFSSKSCRIWNISQMEVIDQLEKKYGVPGVVIEGDMIDSAMHSDSQIETRLEALFETIDSRRK
ncbi:MAG: 2-hydroxyacyl-CoA dehydratase family protein [Spirochaetota bacterium]|nr:2-hydroxyacyl-CoA dehydratase family protein [Spirochaetota bacterium]